MKSASSITCPLTRIAILGFTGVAALSVAACSTSHEGATNTTAATTTPSPAAEAPVTTTSPAAPPPAAAEAGVKGLISSVSGNTVQITRAEKDNATVNFSPTTKVTESAKAALTDVTPGSCVAVRSTKDEAPTPGQPITAATVRISQAVDGKCPAEPSRGTEAPGKRPGVEGAVASVSGKTINVTTTDTTGAMTQATVTVDDKTKYHKQNPATSQAITQGKCLAARGTKDASGAVQATVIHLWAPIDGKCASGKDKEKQPGEHGEHGEHAH